MYYAVSSVSVATRSAYQMYLILTYADLTFFLVSSEVYDLFGLLSVHIIFRFIFSS